MRTCKPVSTISYNSKSYLVNRLEELKEGKHISAYVFIQHKAEEDEKSDHIHLLIFPNHTIDTMDLQNYLKEVNVDTGEMVGCINFQITQPKNGVDEWILYCLHYKPYLDSIGQERVYEYSSDDYITDDVDNLEYLLNHAFYGSKWAHDRKLAEVIKRNEDDPAQVIFKGYLPLNLASQVDALYRLRTRKYTTDRNGRSGHDENDINPLQSYDDIGYTM